MTDEIPADEIPEGMHKQRVNGNLVKAILAILHATCEGPAEAICTICVVAMEMGTCNPTISGTFRTKSEVARDFFEMMMLMPDRSPDDTQSN